jgi:hypothetical protein
MIAHTYCYLICANRDEGTTSMTTYHKLSEVMSIAASDINGQRTEYSTVGAGLFVNAPSGGLNDGTAYPG